MGSIMNLSENFIDLFNLIIIENSLPTNCHCINSECTQPKPNDYDCTNVYCGSGPDNLYC
jgi:hypothetical protein